MEALKAAREAFNRRSKARREGESDRRTKDEKVRE